MVYRIDLTEPGYFWQLRNMERKTYGKTSDTTHTVRRVDGKGRNGQACSLRGELCTANVDVRIQQEGVEAKQDGGDDIFSLHKPYRDYGG